MARTPKRKLSGPFKPIASTDLAWVVGGRIAVHKGPDPEVISGIKTLAESVVATGQVLQQKKQEEGAMMQQMMQQMMGRRG
jgi:hypothetical protein